MGRTGADIVTTVGEIVAYWKTRVYEGDMGTDWSEAHEVCWRCGHYSRLQRCHIIPRQEPFNGPDVPSNYALLCGRCHEEAPSCTDPSEMWDWIKRTHVPFYDTYWSIRDSEELKRVYGLDLEHELRCRGMEAVDTLIATYKKIFSEEVGIHFPPHPFSLASKAFVWKKVFSIVPRTLAHGDGQLK